jgi:hypothetical protein
MPRQFFTPTLAMARLFNARSYLSPHMRLFFEADLGRPSSQVSAKCRHKNT